MRILGLDITRARARTLPPLAPVRGSGGWLTVVREPTTGAWQKNEEISVATAAAFSAVYACVTLIAADIGKCRLRLVAEDDNGIWNETSAPAFSPFIRKPNRYQTFQKFAEQWIVSKLLNGNTYVLKQRDARNVVIAGYVLDPSRVTPLVTPAGDIYYQLARDDLSGLGAAGEGVIVPASEIIHDLMVALFHPLVGVSPIFACGLSVSQGLAIQNNQSTFFQNGSRPGGILTTPVHITEDQAEKAKARWESNFTGANVGKVAVLGDDLKYTPLTLTAVESQLIDQLNWSTHTVCSCYHVPVYMIDIGAAQPVANAAPLLQQYYSQCLQALMTAFEISLDEGLELPSPYGTEFDINDLIWMDADTKTKAAEGGIGSGAMSPNEARKSYYGLGPVAGGDSPYMQQQYYSLEALSIRDQDKPFAKPTPATPASAPGQDITPPDPAAEEAALEAELAKVFHLKAWEAIFAG